MTNLIPPAPPQQQAEPVAWPQLSDNMEYAAQDEFHILPPRMKRLWKRMQELYITPPQPQAEPDRWVIDKVGDKLRLNGKEIDPGTIELRLDGLTYRSSEKVEVKQQAEPVAWQLIETAPKNGSAILVMRDIWPGTKSGRAEECNGHNTYVAAWWDGENNGRGAWVCYTDSVCEPQCPIEPTHWMPLPCPPSIAPPQRKPLTNDEIALLYMSHTDRPLKAYWEFARAIEAAHGIKEQP